MSVRPPLLVVKTITVSLPNEDRIEVAAGTTAGAVLEKKIASEAPRPVAARVNGELRDLTTPMHQDGLLEPVVFESKDGRDIFRHSTSHILAEAVQDLFPGVKFAIGPPIEDGFYYDFDPPRPFTPEDLPRIEARMTEIIRADTPFERFEQNRKEALNFYRERDEPYKVELLDDIVEEKVTLYRQGGFTDLCRGPHLPSSGMVGAFRLLSIAGAYWRGDERNRMLQRIYGTSFPNRTQLEAYLQHREEAQKRDHRKLGRELDLFSFSDEVGPGLVIWHPKGTLIRYLLEEYERREHLARGYQMVIGPRLLREDLWKRSGHYDHYRENMYFTEIEGQRYGIKPMNCLSHMVIYRSALRSYRDLPLRYFELGTVNRHEKSGVLHGLTRVREFTQDDAHILCTPEQLNDEILGVLNFVRDVMRNFDFSYTLELSTRPENSIGSDRDWELATGSLSNALEAGGYEYHLHHGDGAFYGPKIDVKLQDALGRSWQCATVQCDFTMPERFDLTYIGPDGQAHRPVMIHRVVLGSIERFVAILIEHFAGAFPLWLAPIQVMVMTLTSRQVNYAGQVTTFLRQRNYRVGEDLRNEKIGLKIRETQLQKVPYMAIIGGREEAEEEVSIRHRARGDIGRMKLEGFLRLLNEDSPVNSPKGGETYR